MRELREGERIKKKTEQLEIFYSSEWAQRPEVFLPQATGTARRIALGRVRKLGWGRLKNEFQKWGKWLKAALSPKNVSIQTEKSAGSRGEEWEVSGLIEGQFCQAMIRGWNYHKLRTRRDNLTLIHARILMHSWETAACFVSSWSLV